MKKRQPETIILNQVRDYLRMKHWLVIRIQQGLGCHKGISDLIAIKGPFVFFIEIKTPTGKQSEYQAKFERDIIDATVPYEEGARYIVIRHAESAIAFFRNIEKYFKKQKV